MRNGGGRYCGSGLRWLLLSRRMGRCAWDGGIPIPQLRDWRNEAVAQFGHGLNVLLMIRRVPQSLPQCRYVYCQVRFLDEAIGPDSPHQLLFGHEVAIALN
jgi:hypothetical protein